ncbi:MAG: tripartite tricarboxylate transporter TctB family protein [Caldimonas sp.]
MTSATTSPATADVDPLPDEPAADPASELRDALGWLLLGAAVLVGSITMDRLESQGINKYTIPGLVPGLLGIAMILLGAVLGVRSWRRGGLRMRPARADPAIVRRLAIVTVLIVVFAVGLVGHGLPFWVAAALYVIASILILQAPQRAARGRPLGWSDAAFAAAVGIGSGVIIMFVFQDLFLVRLP